MAYGSDVENRDADDERTPMIGRSSSHEDRHEEAKSRWTPLRFLQFFGGGIFAPDPSTYDPIEILLNTDNEKERDELTEKWRYHKLSELNFVGVVVCSFLTLDLIREL